MRASHSLKMSRSICPVMQSYPRRMKPSPNLQLTQKYTYLLKWQWVITCGVPGVLILICAGNFAVFMMAVREIWSARWSIPSALQRARIGRSNCFGHSIAPVVATVSPLLWACRWDKRYCRRMRHAWQTTPIWLLHTERKTQSDNNLYHISGLKYSVIQKDGRNFVGLYFLNYKWYVREWST